MLVKDFMTRHPMMVDPDMSVAEAQSYMAENDLRHLPVVGDGKRLLGLVTRQSLLVDPSKLGSLNIWEIARYLNELTVKDAMIKKDDLHITEPDTTIEDAARIMVENRVGCLPVVEEGVVVGIITEVDIMTRLMEMMTVENVPSVRVVVRMPNVKGETIKLMDAISAQDWGILGFGGVPSPKEEGKWDTVVRIRDVPKEEVIAALEKVEGHEIIDVRETN